MNASELTMPVMEFSRRPSTLAYMLRAFHRSRRRSRLGRFPPLRARWRAERPQAEQLESFAELTGLDVAHPGFALLHNHVRGFRLQMVILTHPHFPVSIWNILQIRNHLLQHRPFEPRAELEWDTRVAGGRLLEKGAEVDLHTSVRSRGELAWESLNTFYFRGRLGGADSASPLAKPPELPESSVAAWHMPPGVGRRFAALTGDYNGIHFWDWYARLFGFRRAFHHPQLVLGQCLAHLPATEALPQRLDAWLKGPVYYGSDVQLRAAAGRADSPFALYVQGDERPAIVGRRTAGAEVRPLLEAL